MTDPTLQETFLRRGLVRLPGLLPGNLICRARDVVLESMRRQGVWDGESWDFGALEDLSPHKQASCLRKPVKKSRAFGDLMTDDLIEALEVFGGGRLVPMLQRPQLLFSLPDAQTWSVPHNVWHVDLPAIPNRGLPGVQIFTFLQPLKARSGGTAVVTGSHRLLDDLAVIGSKQVNRRLKRMPYFRELRTKNLHDRERFVRDVASVGDVELQVAELVGEPGDVYVMDLRLLHAPAPNTSSVPRIMVTQRFLTDTSHAALQNLIAEYRT